MKTVTKVLVFIFLLIGRLGMAEPTGLQLLEACEKTAANRASDIQAMMCEWYVTPCNCESSQPSQPTSVPEVCLPGDISSAELGLLVVKALKAEPELTTLGAGNAVAIILSRNFPCAD